MYTIGEEFESTNGYKVYLYEFVDNRYIGKIMNYPNRWTASEWLENGVNLFDSSDNLKPIEKPDINIPEGYQMLWLNVYKQNSKYTPWHAGGLYTTESRADSVSKDHRYDCVPVLVKKP